MGYVSPGECNKELKSLGKVPVLSRNTASIDTLLQQSVNQEVFETLLTGQFASTHPIATQQPSDSTFTKDELNVLQYACGYVPHILLKRYEKRSGI